jgi:hypothetical protein
MSFALITGANKGIGRAIAFELAGRGIDLLMVARDEPSLKELADTIHTKNSVKAYYLSVDLSQKGAASHVYDWCQQNNFDVQYLINNAGYGLSGKFESYPLQDHLNLMQVNMHAVTELCYLFLPMLKRHDKAYILNIASSAAYQAVPYLGIYAATKAFVLQFSRALRYELKNTSVSVTCISPGATKTGFDARANLGPKALKTAQKFHMQAEEVAKIAVASMFKKRAEVVIGFVNKLGAFFVWLLPKKMVENTAAKIYEED